MMEVDSATLSNPPVNTANNTEMQEDVEMGNEADSVTGTSAASPDESAPPSRLDQIITDYRRVQESASNEIDRKRRAVRSKCEERLWMAALWRDYQLDIVKKSFENEIKQIEREHQSEFNSLKDALLHELQEERRKLQVLEHASSSNLTVDKTGNLIASSLSSAESTNLSSSDAITAALLAAEEQAAAASGRRLRRREEKTESVPGLPPSSSVASGSNIGNGTSATVPAATTSASRRKQVNSIYTYNTLLPEQEILDDLGAIAKEAGSLGTSRRAAAVIKNTASSTSTSNSNQSTVNVSFEKGVLHYNWDIISVSDRIKIQLGPSSSAPPIHATVLSCSASELVISTGGPARNQIKIHLADLKSGKITILTEDQLLHEN